MTANTIVISHNPVKLHESFSWTLSRARGDFDSYDDDDRSMGGYWSASFRIYARSSLLKDLFMNGLGRDVKAWGYGVQLLHEGFIYELVYNLPPDQYTISLQNMLNKVHMRVDHDADGLVERSTTLENTDSQDRFGIKQAVISGGETEGLAVADQATQAWIDLRGFPQPTRAFGSGSGTPYIEVFSRGYVETLSWLTYNQTAVTGTQGLAAQFSDVFGSAEYISAIEVEANDTTVTREYDADRRMLDIGLDLARLGDANNNRWIMYVGKGRILYLVQASPSEVTG